MMAFNLVTFFRNPPAPPQTSAKTKPAAATMLPGTPPIVSHKPVLVSLDIDRTLIPWKQGSNGYDQTAFLRYQHTLQDPGIKKDSFIVLNTGRGLKATRQLAPFLARIPFDAIALNDGQQLFVKPKLNAQFHPIQANQQWIQRLTLRQTDPHWRKELQGWATTKVLRDIRELMPEMEFRQDSVPHQFNRQFGDSDAYVFTRQAEIWKNPEKHRWAIRIEPDSSYLEIKRIGKAASPQETAKYAETLGRVLKHELADVWPNISFKVVSTPGHCLLQVAPKKCDKAAVVDYLANRRLTNAPKAIISAGDYVNDLPLLAAHRVGHIPNYPILLGENPEMKQALSKNPPRFSEAVGWNQLHIGIQKQFQKIRPLIQPKAPSQPAINPANQLNRLG